MKLRITIAAALGCISIAASAQKPELVLHAGGGLSTLSYSLSDGSKKSGFGGNFGLSYSYLVNDHWGLRLGVALATHSSTANVGGHSDAIFNLLDTDGDIYDMSFRYAAYSEKQSVMLLNIPFMLQFRTAISERTSFYAGAGVKIGIPVSAKYSAPNIELDITGHYVEYGVDVPNFEVFGHKKTDNSGTLNLKTSLLASAELGLHVAIGEKHALMIGAYFDYGLGNMHKSSNAELLSWTSAPPYYAFNGSLLDTRANGSSRVERIAPLAVGLKVAYAFDLTELQQGLGAALRRLFLPSYSNEGGQSPYTAPYTAPIPLPKKE